MAAPALSLILVCVLAYSFQPELRRAWEWLQDAGAALVVVGLVLAALPAEVVERLRRR